MPLESRKFICAAVCSLATGMAVHVHHDHECHINMQCNRPSTCTQDTSLGKLHAQVHCQSRYSTTLPVEHGRVSLAFPTAMLH